MSLDRRLRWAELMKGTFEVHSWTPARRERFFNTWGYPPNRPPLGTVTRAASAGVRLKFAVMKAVTDGLTLDGLLGVLRWRLLGIVPLERSAFRGAGAGRNAWF